MIILRYSSFNDVVVFVYCEIYDCWYIYVFVADYFLYVFSVYNVSQCVCLHWLYIHARTCAHTLAIVFI